MQLKLLTVAGLLVGSFLYAAEKPGPKPPNPVRVPPPAVYPENPEVAEWSKVKASRDINATNAFLEKYLGGRFAAEASRWLDDLEWEQIDRKDKKAVQEFLRRHPDRDYKVLFPEYTLR